MGRVEMITGLLNEANIAFLERMGIEPLFRELPALDVAHVSNAEGPITRELVGQIQEAIRIIVKEAIEDCLPASVDADLAFHITQNVSLIATWLVYKRYMAPEILDQQLRFQIAMDETGNAKLIYPDFLRIYMGLGKDDCMTLNQAKRMADTVRIISPNSVEELA